MPGVHRVVLEANLRVGSRFEPAKHNGISHFLEHMLFRGTPSYPSAHQLIVAVEAQGGALTAATSVDHGSLTLEAPPDTFEGLVPVFAEAFRQPVLRDIETERGIVREEILESLDDAGRQIDPDNLTREACFGGHSLGMPITGTLKHLDRFDADRLLAHHRAHYTAEGTVLAVAGPIDPGRTLETLGALFEGLVPGVLPHSEPPPAQTAPRWRYVHHAASSQTALRVVFRAPAESAADEPATDLISRILDDGMSTRLYHRICDIKGLCYDVAATYEAYSDSGILELGAEAAHERASELLRELLEVVVELRDRGPTEAELQKAKDRFRWQLFEMLDDPGDVAEFLGVEHLIGLARTPADRLVQLKEVTLDQLRSAARKVFRAASLTVVAVGILSKETQRELRDIVETF
jgi:predicted Zn-dependent peptidase